VLEMRVRVLTWQTMELVCLHHHDEASAELEVSGPSVDSRPGGHVGNIGNRVVWSDLAIAVVAVGVGSTGLSVGGGGVVRGETVQDRLLLRIASGLSMKFFGRSNLVIHYPCFHPQQEKTSEVILHKQWLPYMHITMNISF